MTTTDCTCVFRITCPLRFAVRYLTVVNCHVLDRTFYLLLLAVFSGVRVGRGGSTSRTGTSGLYLNFLTYCLKDNNSLDHDWLRLYREFFYTH